MRLVALACAFLGAASFPAFADQVTDQLDLGKQYYEEGDLGGAINELQFAIQDIRSQLTEQYRVAFPDAPAGWSFTESAEESNPAMAMLGGGSILVRHYTQDDGRGSFEATITADSPMIQGLATMLTNPAMVSGGAKRIRVGRDNALVKYDEGEDSGESTLFLGGRMMLQLQADGLGDGSLLEEMTQGWKVDQLKKIAGM